MAHEIFARRREEFLHRRRVHEREQHQDQIERVHRQRTIMLTPLWSNKPSQLGGRNANLTPGRITHHLVNFFTLNSSLLLFLRPAKFRNIF
jgi:hypothetical protein